MKVLPFETIADFARAVPEAVAHLQAGGLLAHPTETVYGIGCLLRNQPLEQLAALKGGRAGKSFLLLIARLEDAPGLVWTAAARVLAENFWPGPLTLVLRTADARYPARVVSSAGAVAVRVSPHPGIQLLLAELAEPLTSSSANLPGAPPATTTEELRHLLTNTPWERTLILDGGQLTSKPSSTLVDCSVEPPRLLRAGAVAVEELRRFLHELRT